MKKIMRICCILSALIILTLNFCACCDHFYYVYSDTATCEKSGIITYKCLYCGKTYTEESPVKQHQYVEISNTATCTSDGTITYECSQCKKKITEASSALGHNFNSSDVCKKCGDYFYDITCSNSPGVISDSSYVNYVGASYYTLYGVTVAKISLVIASTSSSYKTLFLTAKLTDSNGNEITTQHDTFSNCKTMTIITVNLALIEINKLSKNVSYTMTITFAQAL